MLYVIEVSDVVLDPRKEFCRSIKPIHLFHEVVKNLITLNLIDSSVPQMTFQVSAPFQEENSTHCQFVPEVRIDWFQKS